MTAEIVIHLPFHHTERRAWTGTEDEIYEYAIKCHEEEIDKFIKENNITTADEIKLVRNIVWHEIIFQTPVAYVVVNDGLSDGNIEAVFSNRADAEEYIFTEAENWAYECLMVGDPEDSVGESEWNYKLDWKFLMNDCGGSFKIVEAPLFDIKEEK